MDTTIQASDIQQQLNTAKSIYELKCILEFAQQVLSVDDYMDLDKCHLPVFGPKPQDTYSAFSWDEENLLILEDCWEIVKRKDTEEVC